MTQGILSYPKLAIEIYFTIYVKLKYIIKVEKVLFDKLRDSNPIVVEDGIIDEAEYKATKYKILYVMKEVNGGEG